jgi:hypothetical protein
MSGFYVRYIPRLGDDRHVINPPARAAINRQMEEKTMHVTDMVMHIGNSLGEQSRRNIEQALSGIGGIIQAHFNEKRPHLMLVSYDTDSISSFEVMARVSGQQLCAERVG